MMQIMQWVKVHTLTRYYLEKCIYQMYVMLSLKYQRLCRFLW